MTQETAALELISNGPGETRHFGRELGKILKAGDLVLLEGIFGAGKTVLVQGIARGLGVAESTSSPSFTLVNKYTAGKKHGGIPVYHADLYRVTSVEEALAFGLDDYLDGRGIFIAEWAENVAEVWPEERLWISLRVANVNKRIIRVDARGVRYVEILRRLERALFQGEKHDSGG